MPRNVTCYEVLIASPSDVSDERRILVDCIEDWNAANSQSANAILLPRRWELDAYPEMGERPQEIINDQIVRTSDLLLGVFWHRIGTPTGISASGTVEEIDQFVVSNRPVSLYFSQAPVPMTHDGTQLATVLGYKKRMLAEGIAFSFASGHEFRRMVSRHLALKMNRLLGSLPSVPAKPKNDLAKVSIKTENAGQVGAVRTVRLTIVIENLSPMRKILEYDCIVDVPSACLTHEMGTIRREMEPNKLGRRRFRVSNINPGAVKAILRGDRVAVFSLDLGLDQLNAIGTPLEGDIDAVLADKVTVEAVIEDDVVTVEKQVSEMFLGMY